MAVLRFTKNHQTIPSNLQVSYSVDPVFTPFIPFSHQHPFFPTSAQTVAPLIVESSSFFFWHALMHSRPVSVSLIFSSTPPVPSPGVKEGQVPLSSTKKWKRRHFWLIFPFSIQNRLDKISPISISGQIFAHIRANTGFARNCAKI
jgi:hypothetical protein